MKKIRLTDADQKTMALSLLEQMEGKYIFDGFVKLETHHYDVVLHIKALIQRDETRQMVCISRCWWDIQSAKDNDGEISVEFDWDDFHRILLLTSRKGESKALNYPYNKKGFLLPDSPRSCSLYHAKIDENGDYMFRLHDCNTGVRLRGNLNNEQERTEAIDKLTKLATAALDMVDQIREI